MDIILYYMNYSMFSLVISVREIISYVVLFELTVAPVKYSFNQ